MPDPRAVVIELSADEREQLESWSRRRTSAQALAERSRIVLAAAEGLKTTEVAERVGVNISTARRWRNRFAEHRLDGLLDEPGRGILAAYVSRMSLSKTMNTSATSSTATNGVDRPAPKDTCGRPNMPKGHRTRKTPIVLGSRSSDQAPTINRVQKATCAIQPAMTGVPRPEIFTEGSLSAGGACPRASCIRARARGAL